jgi:hypothetical protein
MAKAKQSSRAKSKGEARHPKTYKDTPASPVTIPWKRRVLKKLKENEDANVRPCNIDQLKGLIGAAKGSLNKLLDLEREPAQWTTKYLDEITSALGVEPPLLETDDDDPDFVRDVQLLRSLSPDSRVINRLNMERFEKKK